MHARDEKELSQAMQAFLLHFCNVFVRQTILSAKADELNRRGRDCLRHEPLDVERVSRRSLAEADWAMKVNR
jgi:hypothetical protein